MISYKEGDRVCAFSQKGTNGTVTGTVETVRMGGVTIKLDEPFNDIHWDTREPRVVNSIFVSYLDIIVED